MKTKEEIDKLFKTAVLAGLDGTDAAADCSYEEIAAAYNGIGPEWLPEKVRAKITAYLGVFEPAALIHDIRYQKADGSADRFHQANYELRDNCFRLAEYSFPWYSWRRYAAYLAAIKMFEACENFGSVAYASACAKIALFACFIFAAGCAGPAKMRDIEMKGMYVNGYSEVLAIGSGRLTSIPGEREALAAHYEEDTAWLQPGIKTHKIDIFMVGTNSSHNASAVIDSICKAFAEVAPTVSKENAEVAKSVATVTPLGVVKSGGEARKAVQLAKTAVKSGGVDSPTPNSPTAADCPGGSCTDGNCTDCTDGSCEVK